MTSGEWQQAKELLVESSTLPEGEREGYLTSHCANRALRDMVERFLRGAARAPVSWLKNLDTDDPAEVEDVSGIAAGTRLGPYAIVEPLGRGGMGQVFLALDTRLRRKVALKCVIARRSALSDRRVLDYAQARARITREARAAATINHPNVATVHDVIEHDGRAFIVMEYVEGESLAARLRREPIPIASVIGVGRQLASALAAAHEKGIVHRDLKPANVQVKADGTVKVLDFGIAKALPAAAASASGVTTALEVAGVQPGTPGYMSPEQMMGREVDERSDLFSLGVILYELITGHRPLAREPLGTLSTFDRSAGAPSIPPGLAAVVVQLLAFDPDLRLQSASEVESALGRLDRSGNVPTATVAARSVPFFGRRLPAGDVI